MDSRRLERVGGFLGLGCDSSPEDCLWRLRLPINPSLVKPDMTVCTVQVPV